MSSSISFFFFFNDTATTEIYTLSLHDALPIYLAARRKTPHHILESVYLSQLILGSDLFAMNSQNSTMICTDRKSTRLNSSHSQISYAVFCLKKKKKTYYEYHLH